MEWMSPNLRFRRICFIELKFNRINLNSHALEKLLLHLFNMCDIGVEFSICPVHYLFVCLSKRITSTTLQSYYLQQDMDSDNEASFYDQDLFFRVEQISHFSLVFIAPLLINCNTCSLTWHVISPQHGLKYWTVILWSWPILLLNDFVMFYDKSSI